MRRGLGEGQTKASDPMNDHEALFLAKYLNDLIAELHEVREGLDDDKKHACDNLINHAEAVKAYLDWRALQEERLITKRMGGTPPTLKAFIDILKDES